MNFKIDTKEKFTTITVNEPNVYANMSFTLTDVCNKFLQNDIKNIVLNLQPVSEIDETTANAIASLQQNFYEQSASFVICCMQKNVEDFFEKNELLEMLNATPTESEAWDIVQMEEIERELLDSEEETML